MRELEIVNKKGLHARASAKFVQTVEQFDADISVTRGHETVGGTSIMGLMMLAAGPGTTITVEATGKEAAAAVDALCALVAVALRRRRLSARPPASRSAQTRCVLSCLRANNPPGHWGRKRRVMGEQDARQEGR